jgi:hypothetical protein
VWQKILASLAESESGRFLLDHDKITLAGNTRKAKIDSIDRLSPSKSQNESTTPTLFR